MDFRESDIYKPNKSYKAGDHIYCLQIFGNYKKDLRCLPLLPNQHELGGRNMRK